ncbi:GTPase IMAP family member 9-like [Polymixia lowei]
MASSVQMEGYHLNQEKRIVLIGKTGSGKSASGNTIVGREAFESVYSPMSVTSECAKARATVDGRKVAVIDTPGIYDTNYSTKEVLKKLTMCISLSAPGPHVFLIVIKLDRFTEEEVKTVELLQDVFGDKAADYSMVLFTHGDRLGKTTIKDFYRQSPKLCHLIAKCNGQYHVFNNMVPSSSQVSGLLEKINKMVITNGGKFYTNEMFQKAERAIREEEKIQLEKIRQAKKGYLDEEDQRKARNNAEKKNNFTKAGLALAGAQVTNCKGDGLRMV